MATQTTNLGLTKPGYDEAADVVPAVNNNMDAIDAAMGAVPANTSVQAQITANAQAIVKLDESIAIVSNGNTHAAIAAGQYVYIKGHGTLAEGLYTANSAISANATLSNSNVTAVSGGGLNALNSKIVPSIKSEGVSIGANASKTFSGLSVNAPYLVLLGADNTNVWRATYVIYNGSQYQKLIKLDGTDTLGITVNANNSFTVQNRDASYQAYLHYTILGKNAASITVS